MNVSSVSGAVVGPDGNMYVADYQLTRIQEFNAHGRLLATIGNTPGLPGIIALVRRECRGSSRHDPS